MGNHIDTMRDLECTNTGYAKDMESKYDEVNNPSHYVDMAIPPSDFIYDNNLDFFTGNAIKYLCRASKKNGLQDLQKAIKYIEMRIKKEYSDG